MTTVVLILLCLAIAGRELYLAFDRKRPPADQVAAAEIAAIHARLGELEAAHAEPARPVEPVEPVEPVDGVREQPAVLRAAMDERLEPVEAGQARHEEALRAADTRIRSLIEQINDRVLPEINGRLAEQRDTTDRLAAEVARLRRQLRRRLEEAVTASLGGDRVDMVHGLLGADIPASGRAGLTEAYERCTAARGLCVELAEPGGGKPPWHVRYYLSGAGPRELERDFLELLDVLRDGSDAGRPGARELRRLLAGLHRAEQGVAQIGPLLVVRTPRTLLCGVRPLAELLRREPAAAVVKDLEAAAARLCELPETRLCDLSGWRPQAVA